MAADCPPITHYIERACFEVLSKEEVKRISVKKITEPKSFEKAGAIAEDGLYSRALGPVKRGELCATCNQTDITCPGHYGHIELSVPVYHPMLVQTMYNILSKACFDCYRFRLAPPELTLFLSQLEALSCGFDHLVDQLDETAKDICRGEKDSDYINVLLRDRLEKMIQEEKERVPDYECQNRSNQRSGTEKLSQLFRNFINGKLVKPKKLCPHCSEKKTTTKLHEQSTILIGVNVGKSIGRASKSKRAGGGEKMDLDYGGNADEKKAADLHVLKTDKKKVMTAVCARDIFRKLWANEKQTLKRIFRFLNVDFESSSSADEATKAKTSTTTASDGGDKLRPDPKSRSEKLRADRERFVPTDLFFVDCLLVPPGKFRPPMAQQGYSYEGPRTAALSAVMKASTVVGDLIDRMLKEKDEIEAERMQARLIGYWRELQVAVHCLYDNEMDKYGQRKYPGLKQLIDKKEGLFRKNMMGKRVNFAARSVISPDPNISVDQIGVPMVFAKVLTYPQPVTAWNLEQMRQAIKNGPDVYPGAVSIVTDDGITISLTKESTRLNIANRLTHLPRNQGRFNRTNKVGPLVTIVNRHLLTGDVLLFNRQPTLHKPSIMAFRARVLPNEKGFRLHYANCKSFNADFDGDEMNAHLPQSELARSEAYNIASVNYQYLVPKDGSPLGGLIQDHVVAVCLLTMRDVFYDREHYNQLCFCALNFMEKQIKLEPPTIVKPVPLWTGKQVITTIIRNCIPPGKPPLTLEIKSKVGPKIMHVKPAYEKLSDCLVYIKDGELLTGLMDKSNVGATQYGLVHACYELYGGETSSNMMSAFARFATWYLQLYEGFTLGIADILVEDDAEADRFELIRKSRLVGNESAQEALNLAERHLDEGQLEDKLREAHSDRDPLPMKKLDAAMKKRTDDISSSISNRCLPEGLIRRFPDNNLQMMIQSGAKGGTVNALQISCLLGQIELEGRRVPLSMSGRSLPSFKPYDTSPKAGGFVSGRFLTGIQPQEFFFHCMAGREGLIDTAVKTSRSGYLQRCLIKHLEGLTVNYDQTVRDSCGSVIQFLYGEDGLDITRCQMLKDKAFSLLVDNHAIIDPSQDELERLNRAKEAYEEEVIARTNDIQSWVDKNGADRVRRLRGSGFLDFQAQILKSEQGEHEQVFGRANSQHPAVLAEMMQSKQEVESDHEDDCDSSNDSEARERREGAANGGKRVKIEHQQQQQQQQDAEDDKAPASFTQRLVSATPTWKKDRILEAWYALSFKEKRKWNRDWDLCPDPTTATMNPGAHYGVVPERLDERIEEFVAKNPKLIINPASLIGYCDSTATAATTTSGASLLDCDTNPELARTLFAYYNSQPGARLRPKLTKHEFYNLCYNLYMKMLAQPGEAVGLLAAQSIGEPSTQMTLNTFHFAGRGEMNVTLGIPRLREILMTASANIGTPSMDLPLLAVMHDEQGRELTEEEAESQALHVKLNLNAVRLSDVLEYVDITEQMVMQTDLEVAAAEGRSRTTGGRKRMKVERTSQSRAIEYTFLFSFLPSKYYRHEFVTSSKKILHFMETVFKTQLRETISKREKRLQLAETLFDQSGRKKRNEDEMAGATGNQQVDGEEQQEEDRGEASGADKDAGAGGGSAGGGGGASGRPDDVTDDETDEDDNGGGANEPGARKRRDSGDNLGRDDDRPPSAAAADAEAAASSSKHKYLMKLVVKPMTTRLDMGALIKAEARRTYIHRVGNIQRALIVKDMSAKKRGAKCDKMIKTEGVSLLSLVRYSHILDLNAIYSNDIHAIARTYGIEAASQAIRREMANVFAVYGIEVDSRHLSLIADYMTYNGSVRGMNRMSMEACASPLQQMSFESTIRYLKQAAILGLRDDIKSPSAALVFGRPTKSGTGLFTATTSQTVDKRKLNAPQPAPRSQPQHRHKPGWRHQSQLQQQHQQQQAPKQEQEAKEAKEQQDQEPAVAGAARPASPIIAPEECW